MTDSPENSYALDAAYVPFPTFDKWMSRVTLDSIRWQRYTASLGNRPTLSPDVLRRAREVAKRAAAIDTGAIEDLYEVDRGFTYTVAFETAAWEVELAKKGENVRSLFEAQLHAYDYVLDLATKAEPISEAAIRSLHEEICRAQTTYRVMTAVGPQEQPLPKGQYKIFPNHVRTRKGDDHSYAPVDVTPEEMHRFVHELRSLAFLEAHPVLQATYAHYCFVVIHPFADGNGRVARALASVFTYRSISMPIVIFSEDKGVYLDVLEASDRGGFQSFVDFMLVRCLDTIQLVEESIRGGVVPEIGASIAEIDSLYITKGGYTQDQIDEAGSRLVKIVLEQLTIATQKSSGQKLSFSLAQQLGNYSTKNSAYRLPIGGGKIINIHLNSAQPAAAFVSKQYGLVVPKNAGGEDDMQLILLSGDDVFSARVDQLIPLPSSALLIRARMFAERAIGEALQELTAAAKSSLNKHR